MQFFVCPIDNFGYSPLPPYEEKVCKISGTYQTLHFFQVEMIEDHIQQKGAKWQGQVQDSLLLKYMEELQANIPLSL